jgi:hypothetical protein
MTADDHPFDDWELDDGRFLKTDLDKGKYAPVSVTDAYEVAVRKVDSKIKSTDLYAVPLFETDAPQATHEYVQYDPDTEQIKYYDSGSHQINWLTPEEVSTTRLGQRLRWWVPDTYEKVESIDDDQAPPSAVTSQNALSDTETGEFFTELKQLVRRERTVDKEGNRERYKKIGLTQAISQDRVAGPFVPTGAAPYEGGRVYKFEFVNEDDWNSDTELNIRDDAGIFPENEYIAAMAESNHHLPIDVETVYVGDTQLWLRPLNVTTENNSPLDNTLTDSNATLWLHELLNPLPYNRRLDAINEVQENKPKRDLLSGAGLVEFDSELYMVPDVDIQLNPSQQKALIWAVAAEDCVCIHGPPGTGKTRTLTAYVLEAINRGQRVLITAHSNQAVDNLVVGDSTIEESETNTLHAFAQAEKSDLTIARVGTNSKNEVIQRYYQGSSPGGANVVAATTSGAAKFRRNTFDVAVVDEATQVSRAATAIAFRASEKLVLAGDHKQLPPFTAVDEMLGGEQRPSLFETLLDRYGEDIAVMLRTQYRMNEMIASFPNEAFYNGKLETAERNRAWAIDDLSPLMGIHINGSEIEQSGTHSYYNREEAEAAAKQVKLLVNSGVDSSDIGVIAAYRGQVDEIKRQIQKLDIPDRHAIAIDTVDAFQGSEREAIIVSLVRSNENAASGFLTVPDTGPRRLNVALTRGRKRLVVIGNWDTLGEQAPHRDEEESCAQLYSKLEEKIRSQNRMLGS